MLPSKKRLLDQIRDRLRLKNYAYRTEKSYLYWIKQYVLFHNKRRPVEMGGSETVLSKTEVERVLRQMSGETLLMAQLLYGCGLPLRECLSLRVKDVDLEQHQIMVRDPKRMYDRTTILPVTLELSLQAQLQAVKLPLLLSGV